MDMNAFILFLSWKDFTTSSILADSFVGNIVYAVICSLLECEEHCSRTLSLKVPTGKYAVSLKLCSFTCDL